MKQIMRLFNSIVMPAAILVVISVCLQMEYPQMQGNIVETMESDHEISAVQIDRVQALEDFFGKYNSPLEGHADTFVATADKYGIDYTLLPAISCMESTCGKFMIQNTYNPFGWGIYGNNYIAFESFDDAIEVVGEGLNENYFARGYDTPARIAPIYTPPNHVNWLRGVNFFIDEINAQEKAVELRSASNFEIS